MTRFGKIGIILIVLLEMALFVYSPIMGIIMLTMLLYNDKIDYVNNPFHYRLVLLYILAGSLVLGLVNLTKIPESDLVWYMEHFHDAKYAGARYYMKYGLQGQSLSYWKEPMYSLMVWIINRVTNDNGGAFKCILTMLNYCIMGYALVLFAEYKELSMKHLMIGLVALFFIPYIFTMSLQAIRQFLCNSILMLVLVRVSYYDKKDYWLMILAVLIHTSGFLFLPLLLFAAYDRHWKESIWWYVALAGVVIGMRFFAGMLSSSAIGQVGPTSYALRRAAENPDQHLFSHLGWLHLSMMMGFAVLSIYLGYFSNIKDEKGIKRFMHVIIYLSAFVMLNYNNTELAVRFFFYLFAFTPFLIMYSLQIIPKLKNIGMVYFLSLMYLFVSYIYEGPWTYKIESNIMLTHIYEYKEPWEIGRGI